MERIRPRLAPAIATALILAVFLAYLGLSAPFDSDLRGRDMEAYWRAATTLVSGGDLYGREGTPNTYYLYSPWFAAAWIPLTALPRDVVEMGWLGLLLGAVAWLTYPLLRSFTGVLIAMLIVPQVMEYAWMGNADALVLVALALHDRKAGPVLVGLAASLKIAPIAFVIPYAMQRAWGKVALAVAVAAGLWAPAVLFDLSHWIVGPTPYSPMAYSPAAGLAWAGALLSGAYLVRRYPTLSAALVALALTTRLHLYSVGYLLVPSRAGSRADIHTSRASAGELAS